MSRSIRTGASAVLIATLTLGCGNDPSGIDDVQEGDPPPDGSVVFQSGFEERNPFDPAANLWDPPVEQTPPGQAIEASVTVVDNPVVEGSHSVRAVAPRGGNGLNCGKAAVGRSSFDFRLGDDVSYTASYLLTHPLENAAPQLMDVECSTCAQGGPGVRVVTTPDGHLKIDWKFLNWYTNNGLPPPDDAPPPGGRGSFVISPGAWFRVTLRMVLGKRSAGLTQIYVNGVLDSEVVGTNIAPDGLEALDRYPRLQVGVTCLGSQATSEAEVFVDDVSVRQKR